MSCRLHTQVVRLVTAGAILRLHSVQCRKDIKYENSTQSYVSVVCQTLYLHVQYSTWKSLSVLGHGTTRQMNTCMRGVVM